MDSTRNNNNGSTLPPQPATPVCSEPIPVLRSVPPSPSFQLRDFVARTAPAMPLSPKSPALWSPHARGLPLPTGMSTLVLSPSFASQESLSSVLQGGNNATHNDDGSLQRKSSVERAARATLDFKDMWLSP